MRRISWLLSAVRPYLRAFGKLVVIVGNPAHDCLGCGIVHPFGDGAHFLGASAPVPRIVIK
jgi:hypothetical protein